MSVTVIAVMMQDMEGSHFMYSFLNLLWVAIDTVNGGIYSIHTVSEMYIMRYHCVKSVIQCNDYT